jgi:predicted RNA-binding Zn ribbon-like protein
MSGDEFVSRAGRLPLVGGALALDFCNTTSGLGTDHCVEHLIGFEHLVLWSAHAGVLTADGADALHALATREPAATRAALDRALTLRRTLHRLFSALAQGAEAPPEALAGLNAALAPSHRDRQLVASAGGFVWHHPEPHRTADGPLAPIARSAAEVLLTTPLDRIKQCPGQDCGWVFIDRSKNGIRVWCEMEVCGSRAKARARMARRRSG